MEGIHNRMPVILSEGDFEEWLDPKNQKTERLNRLLVPCPPLWMEAYAIGRVKGDGPHLLERMNPRRLLGSNEIPPFPKRGTEEVST
jgi:putative SOS response-associated peptidase YedK